MPSAYVASSAAGAVFDPFNSVRAVTVGVTTTSGNAIIAVYQGSNSASLEVTDNKGNSYTLHVDGVTSGIAIASAVNITGGATHTVTFTVTSHSNPGLIAVLEYAGLDTAGAYDQQCQVSNFIANISGTTGTTTTDNQLVIGAMAKSGTAPTAGSGYTIRLTIGNLTIEDKNVTATGAQVVNFTHAEATAALSGATFKDAVVGGGGSILKQMLQHHRGRRPTRTPAWTRRDSGILARAA